MDLSKYIRKLEQGQTALVLVLIMTVVGVSAVTLASRATLETRTQEISIDSTQARLAAEAGLQEALSRTESGDLSRTINDRAGFTVSETQIGDDLVVFDRILTGEVVEATLSAMVGNVFPINLYWSGLTSTTEPKILISILNKTGVITDIAVAPSNADGFAASLGSASVGGKTYQYSQIIPSVPNALALSLTVIGDDSAIALSPAATGSFPNQFSIKRSIGAVDVGNETVKYGIDYRQSMFDSVPDIFNFALFSGVDIVQ